MPTPIYTLQNVRLAFHLRDTWTGWPTAGSQFPTQPDEESFKQLDSAWATDNLKRISMAWNPDEIQLGFSTIPTVSPVFFVGRVKGRLQHALRLAGTPVKFSRKVACRGIGDNKTSEEEHYVAQQVDHERFSEYDVRALRGRD